MSTSVHIGTRSSPQPSVKPLSDAPQRAKIDMADTPTTSTTTTATSDTKQAEQVEQVEPSSENKPDINHVVPVPETPNKKPEEKCYCKDHDSKKNHSKSKSKHDIPSSGSEDDPDDSSSSESSDGSSGSETEGSDTSLSESKSELDRKRRKQRTKSKAKKTRKVSKKKARRHRDDDSDSESVPENKKTKRSSYRLQQVKSILQSEKPEKDQASDSSSEGQDDDSERTDEDEVALLAKEVAALKTQLADVRRSKSRSKKSPPPEQSEGDEKPRKSKSKKKIATKVDFKRVDQLWDNSIHNYKLSETIEDPDSNEWDQYIFTVRRTFDSRNKYAATLVDIKSKPLREALSKVMHGVKGVSLVQETAVVDPNMLFLYLEEARRHMKNLKQLSKTEKKRKARKAAATKATHLKVLVKYLDMDYAETKKALYPLLDSNMITFDYLWALFKPNTIAYTSTYGHEEEPRAFRLEYAAKESSFMRGEYYSIEGRYLEYDGKTFGTNGMGVVIEPFKGTRKITSLSCYPLKYHRDAQGMREQLIERGKKFVALRGMNYRSHRGMAFVKRKNTVLKVNINGRVMVDPALHRRINPNYHIGTLSPEDEEDSEDEYEFEDGDRRGCLDTEQDDSNVRRYKFKVIEDEEKNKRIVAVEVDKDGIPIKKEKMQDVEDDSERTFTEEELLIASPVALGFAFSEKMWLEFSVSGINEIEWNEKAFDSLVLPENQKSIVKALVSSHTVNSTESIDDVIQGKGRGLVSVLHGPPGTGKTLTAEGIAELLKRPLYMVSVGELGMDSRTLEHELNKILDIAHTWGAVLLLDEADIFLEKRSIMDLHRNALVSIFLRLLEYFQGILFLTTNRVETFDDAFQSRIHVALRYGDLTPKAKRSVWKMFIEKVQEKEGENQNKLTEKDLDVLARHNLNGRQIKNSVRTAQALALNENTPVSMDHIKRVLEVAETFDQDLRGGTGYMDAMRSYT